MAAFAWDVSYTSLYLMCLIGGSVPQLSFELVLVRSEDSFPGEIQVARVLRSRRDRMNDMTLQRLRAKLSKDTPSGDLSFTKTLWGRMKNTPHSHTFVGCDNTRIAPPEVSTIACVTLYRASRHFRLHYLAKTLIHSFLVRVVRCVEFR